MRLTSLIDDFLKRGAELFVLSSDIFEITLRIIAAAFFGGLIGLERDIHGRAAGLRTHLLVSVGAALFTIISLYIASNAPESLPDFANVSDPGRIAAQIVTGIGFLGAGAIIKEGFTVRGLTTAASLWIVAAIGMAVGAGFYLIALLTTVVALIALVVLNYFEKFFSKNLYRTLSIVCAADTDISKIIRNVRELDINILFFEFNRDYENNTTTVDIALKLFLKQISEQFIDQIIAHFEKSEIPLKSITWKQD